MIASMTYSAARAVCFGSESDASSGSVLSPAA